MSCTCSPCATCLGSGAMVVDRFGGYVGPTMRDDLDELAQCEDCGGCGYTDECDECADEPRGDVTTNGIESVFAVLKRGLIGVYHRASAKHLGRYVDEFTFRLNEGNCAIPTMARLDALAAGTVGKRLTYKDLIAKEAN